ncbi:MAG: type II secretion system protein L [Lysobacteraceae bacterium]|nr:MAG: type II secretion system protein L [Xanthomonadaceae bacterium]
MPYAQHVVRCLPDGSSQWLALGRDGRVVDGPHAGLPPAAGERLTLILPAEEVLCLRAPRVAKSLSALAEALPFAIEEQLAAPVESLHIAFDARALGEQVPVAVIDADRLAQRLAWLAEAGLAADACHAEWQLVPGEGGRLWLEQGRALLVDEGRALCLAEGDLEGLAEWLRGQGLDPASLPRWRVGAAGEGERPVAEPLVTLAEGLARRPFNLLSGRFAPRRRLQGQQQRWRRAAAAAALAALLLTLQPMLEARMLERHVREREAQMAQLLREAVPGVQRVVDPVAQLRTALRRSGGRDALDLLGRVAPLLAAGTSLTLEAAEYRGGTLELTLLAPDVATLDGLRERMVSQGLAAELTAANPGAQGVEGRLRVREGGA